MTNNKPEIVFVFQNVLGGVSSFNFNIINFSTIKSQCYIKLILIKDTTDNRPLFNDKFNVDEQILFNFSYTENQYQLQKRLNNYIGNAKGAVVTDYGLVVEAARRFNNPKTIFNLIHDYFYVNQQLRLGELVDVAIAHASFFADAVFASNPEGFAGRSFFIPYGVQIPGTLPIKGMGPLNLVFLGRLEKGKGVMNLLLIQKQLQQLRIEVNWTIIGKGTLRDVLREQWKNQNVNFYEPNTTSEVYSILSWQDIFIFPTSFEGTPVAILECLANGVLTITNDLPGGIRDIVKEGIGFRCPFNNVEAYVNKIKKLHNDRDLLQTMQKKCYSVASQNYDIRVNADKYFEMFLTYETLARPAKTSPKKLQKLDVSFIPNWLAKTIRSLK